MTTGLSARSMSSIALSTSRGSPAGRGFAPVELGKEAVLGCFDVDGSRAAVGGLPDGHVEVLGNAPGLEDRAGELGHRFDDVDLVEVLEGAGIEFADPHAAADREEWGGAGMRVGDAGEHVGESGTCGADAGGHSAGGEGPSLGHVGAGFFVADRDDADAFCGAALEDRIDVPAHDSEEVVDAMLLHHPRCEGAAGCCLHFSIPSYSGDDRLWGKHHLDGFLCV
jgi:hypothetical protein